VRQLWIDSPAELTLIDPGTEVVKLISLVVKALTSKATDLERQSLMMESPDDTYGFILIS
jgi:hypothetical protein